MLIAKKDRESEALELEEAACVDIFGTVLSSSPSPPLSQSSDVCLEGVSKDLLTEVGNNLSLICFMWARNMICETILVGNRVADDQRQSPGAKQRRWGWGWAAEKFNQRRNFWKAIESVVDHQSFYPAICQKHWGVYQIGVSSEAFGVMPTLTFPF